ncbi:hypothetical protein E2C01_051889 [Portunus trituberculatus]|uniref:Uncharacterized protein n=1 Tax=Portunus trituberculatus TaxID=210409 RepID=A0A5B7GK04_PORTR|nr:hypothetical protein [Portunus trituberculatus]
MFGHDNVLNDPQFCWGFRGDFWSNPRSRTRAARACPGSVRLLIGPTSRPSYIPRRASALSTCFHRLERSQPTTSSSFRPRLW